MTLAPDPWAFALAEFAPPEPRPGDASPGALADWVTAGREMQAPHLDLVDQAFADIAAGTADRVLIAMPPRHGKTRRASRWGPLWYLRRFPDRRVALASYGADLADEHGRWCRDQIEAYGDDGPLDLGLRLRPGSKAANRWDLAGHEGGMVTTGIGGALTGRGAHLLIVDDPVKDAADADSPTMRRRAWDWWQSTALTRLEPGGAVLLIQTRWHEDDLAGRVLADEGERWRVLTLPALAESDDDLLGRDRGAPLWPARYDREALAGIRSRVGSRVWTALYQQRPAPPEGAVFRRSWIRHVDPVDFEPPVAEVHTTVVSVDPAATSADSADDTGIMAISRGRQWDAGQLHDRLWVRADRTVHDTPAGWGRAACLAVLEFGADAIVVEANQGGEMAQFVVTQAWRQLASEGRTRGRMMPAVRRVHVRVGKRLRAEPVAALYESGAVAHVGELPDLEDQMTSWVGEGDSPDRLDALTLGVAELTTPTERRERVVVGQRWAGSRRR